MSKSLFRDLSTILHDDDIGIKSEHIDFDNDISSDKDLDDIQLSSDEDLDDIQLSSDEDLDDIQLSSDKDIHLPSDNDDHYSSSKKPIRRTTRWNKKDRKAYLMKTLEQKSLRMKKSISKRKGFKKGTSSKKLDHAIKRMLPFIVHYFDDTLKKAIPDPLAHIKKPECWHKKDARRFKRMITKFHALQYPYLNKTVGFPHH